MTIIGIDLGTTNSACGIFTEQGIKLIPNRLGDNLTPSVVGIDNEGKVITGKIAKERLITHPSKTVANFKRLMGTNHKIVIGSSEFTATELSSIVIKSLKEDAEEHTKKKITEAVISVPAYFNDNQRQATKQAAELAGLKVERLINEPTAAAMAYGLNDKKESTFLIFDMGGGTFDVSMLEFFDGIMEVHASAGDNYLGGEDFVDAMIDNIFEELNLDKQQASQKELQILYMLMETAKRNIGLEAKKTVEFRLASKEYTWDISSEWFNKIATPLLLRMKKPIETVLRDANFSRDQVDEIILVGGATKMGVLRSVIGKMFNRLPSCHLDPDLVVAMGAAIQAGLKEKNKALDDIVLTDVCPYTLGIATVNEEDPDNLLFSPIIERNSAVPISIVANYNTVSDNQTKVAIKIYQGEQRYVAKNIYLGQLEIKVPKNKAQIETFDIRFSYDMNGLLEVDVTILSTQKQHSLQIKNNSSGMDEKQFKAAHARLEKLKFHPRESEENRAIIAQGERLYEISLGDQREFILSRLKQFDAILNKQNHFEIKKMHDELKLIFSEIDNQDWL